MHIVSHKSLQRPDYVYSPNGVGYSADAEPHIVWNHIDGPLLRCRNGSIHWLTWRERIRMWFGLDDIYSWNVSASTDELGGWL
jgi:hypothetical protein